MDHRSDQCLIHKKCKLEWIRRVSAVRSADAGRQLDPPGPTNLSDVRLATSRRARRSRGCSVPRFAPSRSIARERGPPATARSDGARRSRVVDLLSATTEHHDRGGIELAHHAAEPAAVLERLLEIV